MSETAEVIETDAEHSINPPIENEVDAVNAINAIREAARAEFKNENEHLTKQVELLSQGIDSLSQQLEPLKKFEKVLTQNIRNPLPIQIHGLSDDQIELLYAIAEEHYPEQSKKVDSGVGEVIPINRMFSDLTWKLVESGYKSCWLQQLIIGKQFIVRDGV